jgi:hypothetical protein
MAPGEESWLFQVLQRQQLANHPSFQGQFLDEKQGHFAEKQGSHGNYFAHFFEFFRFFGNFSVASHCLSTTSGNPTPLKKIMPKTLP